jgi:hypothetical protein
MKYDLDASVARLVFKRTLGDQLALLRERGWTPEVARRAAAFTK